MQFDARPNPELSELSAPPGVIGDRILRSVRAGRTPGSDTDVRIPVIADTRSG